MHFKRLRTTLPKAALLTVFALIGVNLISPTEGWFQENEYINNFAMDAFGAPLIFPTKSDVTLEVNSNFTFRCESRKPITWRTADLYIQIDESDITNSYSDSNFERPYVSILTLHNVNSENVQYYYCVEESEKMVEDLDEVVEQFKASKIYVFVNDLDNLLAPHGNPIIPGYQYSDVVIPCKPTSKEVDVELLAPNGETVVDYDRFDPKLGFTFLNVSHTKYIKCKLSQTSGGNLTEDHLFAIVIQTMTRFVNKPTITSGSSGHALEGDTFNLTCSVEITAGVLFTINWETPKDSLAIKENRAVISDPIKETMANSQEIGKSILTIHNASKNKDTGYYKCEVEDHSRNKNSNSHLITVLGPHESYINLSEPSNHYKITVKAGRPAQMLSFYRGYPRPSLTWFNNRNISISETSAHNKYIINQTDSTITLKITDTTLKDSGEYYLRGANGVREVHSQPYKLLVKDKPQITMENLYIQKGGEARIEVRADAFPKPIVECSFKPCKIEPKWPSCDDSRKITFGKDNIYLKEDEEIYQTFEVRFDPEEPGEISCIGTNTLGKQDKTAEVLIGDLIEPFAVYGIDDNKKIAVGDEVSITCAALAYNYSAELYWYLDDAPVQSGPDIQVASSYTDYSYRTILKFKHIQHKDKGLYECRARPVEYGRGNEQFETKFIDVLVYDPSAPVMESSNLDSESLNKSLGDSLWLECKASGIPKPIVTWFKDYNQLSLNVNNSKIFLQEDGTVLRIPFIKPEHEGEYKCVASNKLGSIEKSTRLRISDMPGLKMGWIIGIAVMFLVLIIFIVYLCIRICRERELRRQLKAAGLANFEEGAVECINPALSLDEQADLLPYDRRFEFPKEKLKLGKQLGAGAFGVVLKATADGIIKEEQETIVAVKMVKKTADYEVIRALVSELKIMVHLGQHLNVVNLLGAVTKDIAKREIMVIVEYCRYGNVQNFLLKNRKRFINQINPATDEIDPTITTQQRLSSDYEYNSGGSHPNTQGYVRQSEIDYIGSHIDSCNTEQTLISSAPEGESVLSNNSVQPAWRSNYKPDCTTAMDITTTDLVSWAFQVARGMDYLATRKVLHGDLAARNILLCDHNIVKICDFGLARTMYKNDNYKKQGEARLPIKWLAIESLGDQVFSTYSDVWSFGIVLWEFFSLAKVPYPGMEANQTLYLKLKDGYRMAKPEFANQKLYDIMLECWSANPESRPLFNVLEKNLGRLLDDEMSAHYIDLNEPYLRVNSLYQKTGQTDYLALMGCPDEPAPNAPDYVNGHIQTYTGGKHGDPGSEYLQMSPSSGVAIFSPRSTTEYASPDKFIFPQPASPTISNNLDSPMAKNRKKPSIPEEIPILKQGHFDSETESSPDPTVASKSFARLQDRPNNDIEARLEANENYVNVHSNGNNHRKAATKDAFSNPSYLMLQTINETKNK